MQNQNNPPISLVESQADLEKPVVIDLEAAAHPLARYSLRDSVEDLERQTKEERPLLGNIALMAQATVIYAKPNTGKTLLALHLIIEGIQTGLIEPSKLIYLNMDDHATGLLEKAQLASDFGFHMLADGHKGFEAKTFAVAMSKMIETGTASGTVVILDTLKKFVDTMHKGKTRDFTRAIRKFVLRGGTVVALSHTNKKPGVDGKPVYAGTSDVVDDFDCAVYLSEVPDGGTAKVVEFTNFKRRGNVALTAAYTYSATPGICYSELLLSVKQVDADFLEPLKQAAEQRCDAEMIGVISKCIREGFNSKMLLIKESSQRSKTSMKAAQAVIEKYCGPDPKSDIWDFEVRARGQKFFSLLEDLAQPTD
jgi:hypothetical protein